MEPINEEELAALQKCVALAYEWRGNLISKAPMATIMEFDAMILRANTALTQIVQQQPHIKKAKKSLLF